MFLLIDHASRPLCPNDLAGMSKPMFDDFAQIIVYRRGVNIDEYLTLTGNYLVEFVDGAFQYLPMPDPLAQAVATEMRLQLDRYAEAAEPLARTVQAPSKLRLSDQLWRVPDVSYASGQHAGRRHDGWWDAADLIVEVVQEPSRDHDLATKRADYAAAGIPEYWIVDVEPRQVRVLTLPGGSTEYVAHGEFGVGQTATSVLLAGFAVDVAELFAAAERRL